MTDDIELGGDDCMTLNHKAAREKYRKMLDEDQVRGWTHEECLAADLALDEPCPFCGKATCLTLIRVATASRAPSGEPPLYAVNCSACGACGPCRRDEGEALWMWEQRGVDVRDAAPRVNEALKGFIAALTVEEHNVIRALAAELAPLPRHVDNSDALMQRLDAVFGTRPNGDDSPIPF